MVQLDPERVGNTLLSFCGACAAASDDPNADSAVALPAARKCRRLSECDIVSSDILLSGHTLLHLPVIARRPAWPTLLAMTHQKFVPSSLLTMATARL